MGRVTGVWPLCGGGCRKSRHCLWTALALLAIGTLLMVALASRSQSTGFESTGANAKLTVGVGDAVSDIPRRDGLIFKVMRHVMQIFGGHQSPHKSGVETAGFKYVCANCINGAIDKRSASAATPDGDKLAASALAMHHKAFTPGRLSALQSNWILIPPVDYNRTCRSSHVVHHWKLQTPLLTRRRNHDCSVIGDALVLLVGRFAPNIEIVNLTTGQQEHATGSAQESLLDLSHTVNVRFDARQEIWLPCGFLSSSVNKEISADAVTIINTATTPWVIRRGPSLNLPRGGCGALPLHVSSKHGDPDVCLFGGSIGSHNKGKFLADVACYNLASDRWHKPFPDMPVVADHVNVVHTPAIECPDSQGGAPARVVVLNFRQSPYGIRSPAMYAVDLYETHGGRIEAASEGWYVLANDTATQPRDAAGVVLSPSGRFIIMFGGVHAYHAPDERLRFNSSDEVRAFDMCRRAWIPNLSRMTQRRFAIEACKGGDYAFVCAGTSPDRSQQDVHENLGDCEAFSVSDLEFVATNIADDCTDWKAAG